MVANDIGAETPDGVQQKVDTLASVGNIKTVKQLDEDFNVHLDQKG